MDGEEEEAELWKKEIIKEKIYISQKIVPIKYMKQFVGDVLIIFNIIFYKLRLFYRQ